MTLPPVRTRLALTVLAASQVASLLLISLRLASSGQFRLWSTAPFLAAFEFGWLIVSAIELVALLLLFRASAQRTLPLVATVLSALGLALDLLVSEPGLPLAYMMMLNQLVTRALVLVLLVRSTSNPAAIPLAIALGAAHLMRLGLGSTLLWAATNFGPDSSLMLFFTMGRPVVALLEGIGLVALIMLARASSEEPGGAERTASPGATADFVKGTALLGLGLAGTALSASYGGSRVMVLTGAIGVGLGLLIRGLIRLARS